MYVNLHLTLSHIEWYTADANHKKSEFGLKKGKENT